MSTTAASFRRGVQAADRVAQAAVACLVASLVGISFAQIIFRYALVRPLFWADELSRYLYVWIAFVGAGVAMGANLHYGFDYLTEKCPRRAKAAIRWVVNATAAAFVAVCVVAGIYVTYLVAVQKSPSLQISMSWVYAALPIGSLLLLLHIVDQSIFGTKAETEDRRLE
jgi:TRAP-type C4-dicarboxylate transport system permease small subunit